MTTPSGSDLLPGTQISEGNVGLLRKGDLLKIVQGRHGGGQVRVVDQVVEGFIREEGDPEETYHPECYTFVCRPNPPAAPATDGEGAWTSHNPRYGCNCKPVADDEWVQVKGSMLEKASAPQRAGDLYWGDQDDCDTPIRWYRIVQPVSTPAASPSAKPELTTAKEVWDLIASDDPVIAAMKGRIDDSPLITLAYALIADRKDRADDTRAEVERLREQLLAANRNRASTTADRLAMLDAARKEPAR